MRFILISLLDSLLSSLTISSIFNRRFSSSVFNRRFSPVQPLQRLFLPSTGPSTIFFHNRTNYRELSRPPPKEVVPLPSPTITTTGTAVLSVIGALSSTSST
ncbi:hypothetical protein C2S52_019776 [Perilla frutescens var. hirtella]|nr:hypothetical protein C2S52_019776 [Perilla frutescens var. hirtella]